MAEKRVDEIDVSGYTGAAGDEIVVLARDDFDPSAVLRAGVVGVSVALTDADGNAIEEGAAVETPANSGRWALCARRAQQWTRAPRCASRSTGHCVVTATDRPGGVHGTRIASCGLRVAEAEEEKAV